ncbi:MAG: hypothetical protein IT490_14005 [Candidatus Contendobacter sp.]|nr:hypothetical protein [Candidatus Contendobacter sp.]
MIVLVILVHEEFPPESPAIVEIAKAKTLASSIYANKEFFNHNFIIKSSETGRFGQLSHDSRIGLANGIMIVVLNWFWRLETGNDHGRYPDSNAQSAGGLGPHHSSASGARRYERVADGRFR